MLRYACLELRFAIEAITYEKLYAHTNYVPAKIFEKWQPNHALKILLQFEPDADENVSLFISPESAPGKSTGNWSHLGEHRTFKLSCLNKHYNKLGSYLHVRRKTEAASAEDEARIKLRAVLPNIVAELEPIVSCDLKALTLATRVQFKCQVCGHLSLVNVKGTCPPKTVPLVIRV